MRRLIAATIVAMIAASAMANAAMGLALEMFLPWTWALYVVAMIALEAYWIGVRGGIPVDRAITNSIIANLATALCGVGMGCQVLAPVLHYPLIGSSIQPRPFPNAIVILTVVGALSSVLEAAIWDRLSGLRSTFGKRSFVAHLIGVPLALCFLLIPNRPYVGLEGTSATWRRLNVYRAANRALRDDPTVVESSTRLLGRMREIEPQIDICLRTAEFSRFDCTGEGGEMEIPTMQKIDGKWTVQWRNQTIAHLD